MRKELLVILRRVARRLLLRRVLESCAVMAVAGGLCAAAVELGWWLCPVSRAAGAGACALAVLGGALLWLRGGLRRSMGLDVPQAAVAAGLLVAGGSAGAAGAMLGWLVWAPAWGAPVVLICAAVAAGAVLAVVRGVSVLQAAVYLDIHGRLDERLATAAEAATNEADGPLAERLYAQALDALSGAPYRKVPAWKRTRATLGALVLAVPLCVLTGLLPTLKSAEIADLGDLPGAVTDMSGPERVLVVGVIEGLAKGGGVPAAVAEALGELAPAVGSGNDERVTRAVEELVKKLEVADEATQRRIEDAILAAARTSAGAGTGSKGGAGDGAGGNDARGDGPTSDPARVGGTGVAVYHPEYAAKMRKNGDRAPGDDGRVSMDYVWRRSCIEATHALDTGQVPFEYRPIIRKFFATEQ